MFVVNFFFNVFINHFPTVHKSFLCKITTYPLHFWDIYDINLWEKKLAVIQLIHAEQILLYDFIILRKKETPTQVFSCGICETFKNSCGCFWKQVTYIIKSYIRHKFANIVFLLNCIYCWPDDETWNLNMMWCDFEQAKNEQAAETCAWNENKYCSCCIILIRIDTILLIKNI